MTTSLLAAFALLREKRPRWADTDGLRALGVAPPDLEGTFWSGRPSLPEHPGLRPWADQILDTALPAYAMKMETVQDSDPPEALMKGPFTGGPSALWNGEWPTCESCETPLGLVFQAPGAALAPLVSRADTLTVFSCYGCVMNGEQMSIARWHASSVVCRTPARKRDVDDAQSIELVPLWSYPDVREWSNGEDTTLFDTLVAPFALGAIAANSTENQELVGLHDIGEFVLLKQEYLALTAPRTGYRSTLAPLPHDVEVEGMSEGMCRVGGYPSFSQEGNLTPSCEACNAPSRHLLSLANDSFGDGALNVFYCDRDAGCPGLERLVCVVHASA